ncbi:MAG: hypothetical protein K2M40_08255 [Muribaculaceae bacterium]|nr:hypothetical protein [Muribaculaceae bacterium]
MRILLTIIVLICSVPYIAAQTTNIQIQVNNSSVNNSEEYTINGIPKSKDIGGVDITAKQSKIEFGFLSTRGFAYNGTLPVVSGITLTNYNSRPVTVILQLNYKTNDGLRPYPRFYNEDEKILTVVIPAFSDVNHSKYVALPSSGNVHITEIISADMIVRALQ